MGECDGRSLISNTAPEETISISDQLGSFCKSNSFIFNFSFSQIMSPYEKYRILVRRLKSSQPFIINLDWILCIMIHKTRPSIKIILTINQQNQTQKILLKSPKIISIIVRTGSPQQQQAHIAQQVPQPDFFGGGDSVVQGASP